MTDTIPLRLSPLHAALERLGAQFTDAAGWRLAEVYSTVEQEIMAVRAGCGLADVTPHGKVRVEGEAAHQTAAAAFGLAPEDIGGHAHIEGAGHLYRLRADLFYLSTPPGGEGAAQDRLRAAAERNAAFVTVTDVTHGLADLRVIGPAAPQILSHLCGLDFHSAAFPNHTAKQTGLAKTPQLIIRRDFGDLPAYTVVGARSLAAYVWETILTAGQAYGLVPVGVAALRALEGGA